MRLIWSFALGASALLATLLALYFAVGGLGTMPGSDAAKWGALGSYIGGIAGPIFTAGGALFLAYQIILQQRQIARAAEDARARDYLRYIEDHSERIKALLERRISTASHPDIRLGDLVRSLIPKNQLDAVDRPPAMAAMTRLLYDTAEYCESIRLYRDNLGLNSSSNLSNFALRIHVKRARDYLHFLRNHMNWLPQNSEFSLEVAEHLLEEDAEEDDESSEN